MSQIVKKLKIISREIIPTLKNLKTPESVISDYIENKKLFSTGLSYIDAVLLCSAKASGKEFFTSDKLLLKYMKE